MHDKLGRPRSIARKSSGNAPTQSMPSIAKALPLKLSKQMSIEDLFQAITGNCITQIQTNAICLGQAYKVENLHQMRVGLRRLRSALKLFKNVICIPEKWQQDIKWLGDILGSARNWDVLIDSTLPQIADTISSESQFTELKLAAQEKSNEKHAMALAAVCSRQYTQLIVNLSIWIDECGWRDVTPPKKLNRLKKPADKFVGNILLNKQAKLFKLGKDLHKSNSKNRHRMRIAAKEARYASEFFQSLYPTNTVKPFLKMLAALQNELGYLNDATVADFLLKELQLEQKSLEASIKKSRTYLRSRSKNDVKIIHKLWENFALIMLPY